MQKNDMIKRVFVNILQALGTNVKDVKVKLEKVKLNDMSQELQIPDVFKKLIEIKKETE